MVSALCDGKGQEERDPYWSRPWPAALVMAATILARPELVCGKHVCEIGAGLGIAGIAAALAGTPLHLQWPGRYCMMHKACHLLAGFAQEHRSLCGPLRYVGLYMAV